MLGWLVLFDVFVCATGSVITAAGVRGGASKMAGSMLSVFMLFSTDVYKKASNTYSAELKTQFKLVLCPCKLKGKPYT